MLKLAYENYCHHMWQLSYIGEHWKDFVVACYDVHYAMNGIEQMFWQGSESNLNLRDTRPVSWEMFEFWTDDQAVILDFAIRVAAVLETELIL